MKNKFFILLMAGLVVGVAGVGIWFWRGHQQRGGHSSHAAKYYCPMHPTYISDRPGSCPICNMALVLDDASQQEDVPEDKVSMHEICILHKCNMANCPMEFPVKEGTTVSCPVCGTHVAKKDGSRSGEPLYYRHPMRPEVTSPIMKKDEMGMDYVAVYAEEEDSKSSVSGLGGVTLTPERRHLIGMKSEVVKRRPLAFTIRASGRVAYDPDLYNAIAEYREAVMAKEQVKENPWPDVQERSQALVRASLLRLRQMGLSESQIEEISKSKEEQSTSLLLGGADGNVWVYAQIYEYEIGLVKPGQKSVIETSSYRGRKFEGTVKAVDPILSAETRSLKVRIEAPNPEGLLKLEMFVNVGIRVDLGLKLALPEGALMETGERQIVFIDLGEGRIEPREVRIGQEADGYYEILSGIREGENVVTTANFLIDSESKLKSAISTSKDKVKARGAKAKPEESHSGHQH